MTWLLASSTKTVFIRDEVLLAVPIGLARARLAQQLRKDSLRNAAYAAVIAGHTPLVEAGLAEEPERFQVAAAIPYDRAGTTVIPIRWYAPGAGGEPTLDANLELRHAEPAQTLLTLTGVYKPWLARPDETGNHLMLDTLAVETARGFITHVGQTILHVSQ
jgi:hypothetical protein